MLDLLGASAAPLVLRNFSPLFAALFIWVAAVVYGLVSLRSHPKGLRPLFFTEMWERFSFYGMRALLLLYMRLPTDSGGLGFSLKRAGLIYGLYTFLVYAFSVPGGWAADKLFGARRAVAVGGVLIAIGELGLAAGPVGLFFGGLLFIVLGTGLLKPNCTALVGQLYGEADPRRDIGYSIYYMGINIGALVAPLVLGFLAQEPYFVQALGSVGLDSPNGWRWAFGFASLAMMAGLVQYAFSHRLLGEIGQRKVAPVGRAAVEAEAKSRQPLTPAERQRMMVVAILVVFIMTFFFVFEQAGTTLNLFAADHTRCEIAGFRFPSAWLQSVNSIWLLLLAPIVSSLWVRLGRREPSSPVKFTLGLVLVGCGALLLVTPSLALEASPGLRVAPWWLVGTYLLNTVGELCLSPVGLSTVSKLAPPRYAGQLMGVFFFAMGAGNMLAGVAGSLSASLKLSTLFLSLFVTTAVMALALLLMTPRIKSMMGDDPAPSPELLET
jgi:POT family proton-dependent oligopeptide transporter